MFCYQGGFLGVVIDKRGGWTLMINKVAVFGAMARVTREGSIVL